MENEVAKQKERRFAERYDVSLHGTSVTPTGRTSNIEVTNISSSGLQFDVDQIEMLTLIPNTSQHNSLSPVTIDVNIILPFSGEIPPQPIPILIRCGIVYVRRKSLDLCSVGCRFEHFKGGSCKRLTEYISGIS